MSNPQAVPFETTLHVRDRCLCLGFLKWVHRFARPGGVKYPLTRWNKVRNYVLGHQELGQPLDRVHEHFVVGGLFSQKHWDYLLADPIAHISEPAADAAGGPQLYLMSVAGGGMQRIPTNISGYCAAPDWNRVDPNKIAFTIRIGRGYQVAVYDFSKRASVQASRAPFDGIEPSWLPDGRHLVYTARDRNTSRLCVLDTETGKSTPLSPTNFGPTLQGSVWMP